MFCAANRLCADMPGRMRLKFAVVITTNIIAKSKIPGFSKSQKELQSSDTSCPCPFQINVGAGEIRGET